MLTSLRGGYTDRSVHQQRVRQVQGGQDLCKPSAVDRTLRRSFAAQDVVNPSTGKVIAKVDEAGAKDVDAAVEAAQKAYDTAWGLKVPGHERGKLLIQLAEAIEKDADIIAAIESMDNGKAFTFSRGFDISEGANCLRYVRRRSFVWCSSLIWFAVRRMGRQKPRPDDRGRRQQVRLHSPRAHRRRRTDHTLELPVLFSRIRL